MSTNTSPNTNSDARSNVQGDAMTAHNIYSQHGCIGCKPCEGGAANIGRGTVLWTIGILTCGIGLIFLPFYKKCQFCGHNSFMNRHGGHSA